MKIIAALVVLPLLLLTALGLAAYQMVASIPPWLLVALIVYLLWRRGHPARGRSACGRPPRQAALPPAWTAPAAQLAPTPAPPLIVLLVQAATPAPPRQSSAPEPWKFP